MFKHFKNWTFDASDDLPNLVTGAKGNIILDPADAWRLSVTVGQSMLPTPTEHAS